MRSVTIRAFAKINLSLRVGDVRADGYHPVQTLLQGIDLFDTVRIVRRPGPFEIRCETKGVPLDRTNLVWQAADVLWQTTGRAGEPRDVLVTLRKGIPMPDGVLHAMAAQLGSDVPYFLIGGTSLGLGRGEEVYPLEDLPRLWVVLALPPFGVSTRDAYAWLDEKRLREPFSRESDETGSGSLFPHVTLVNDLEAPVVARHPVIGSVKERLAKSGALVAAMSGSGSAVFGVFRSAAGAARGARALTSTGVRVLTARFLPRRRAKALRY